MGEWIDVRDALPELGEFVLIKHNYRLSEYGTPYAIGQRLQFHGSSKPSWVWIGGKRHSDNVGPDKPPLEWVCAHALRPGNRYVTHWKPIEPPKQGLY